MTSRRIIAPILSVGATAFQSRFAFSQESNDADSTIEKMKQLMNFNSENVDVKAMEVSLYDLIEYGSPGKIGYGFMMGYSSGFCLKKVSKVAAFSLGGVFILVQTLSSQGYLVVNHDKIQREVESVLDVNKDGKIDSQDATAAFVQLQEILSYNLPTSGGFGAGLLMGLRG